MPEDIDYFKRKRPDKTYVSRPFPIDVPIEGGPGRNARIVSKVFDTRQLHEFVRVKDQVVLRVTQQERQEVKATFYEDTRQIRYLTIQRFTRRDGKPHRRTQFTFSGTELDKLYGLLKAIHFIDLPQDAKTRLDDDVLEDLFSSSEDKRSFFLRNISLVEEIAQFNITSHDLVALAYRRKQLQLFEDLLSDPAAIPAQRDLLHLKSNEAVWQHFFEQNQWIFGYGLRYVFMTGLDQTTLEQITAGHQVAQAGKRIDALMKTRGLVSSLCFIEIKTPETKLLKQGEPYRSASWAISPDLAGGIAQIQKTLQLALKTIQASLKTVTSEGDPTGEIAFLYEPKAYIVIGNLAEFLTTPGVNEQKFSSFELFRRNLSNPEIITFDELLARARFIARQEEEPEAEKEPPPEPERENEIPF